MSDKAEPATCALRVRAATRQESTPEIIRLVCAASLALILGVACGLWVFARLAVASSTPSAPPPPDARPAVGPTITSSQQADTPPSPDGATQAPHAEEKPNARAQGTSHTVAAVEGRGETRAAVRDKDATAAAVADSPSEATLRRGAAPNIASQPKTIKREGRADPCALYASAGSLSLRGGGTATLVLGGPGPFNVTTPDWSDIAVFSEGRTGVGDRVWTKYVVRSVSRRAGSYKLHLKSPCGAQTVPVRVTPQ